MNQPSEKEWWSDMKEAFEDHRGMYTLDEFIGDLVDEAQRRTWEEAKKRIDSSHMTVCGNPGLASDVKASVKLFKQALIRGIDSKIQSLK